MIRSLNSNRAEEKMHQQTNEHADVVIIGAGPVGGLAALQLALSGRSVTVVEVRSRAETVRDARTLALSWNSMELLRKAGSWPNNLPVSLIDRVHVSQQGAFGRTLFKSEDIGLPHLGAVVDYPVLVATLTDALECAGVKVLWRHRVESVKSLKNYAVVTSVSEKGSNLLSCRLAVMADGGALAESQPGIKQFSHDYRQCAVLAEVRTELPPEGIAYQRFTHHGPLAMLPHGDTYMLVWTRSPEDAARLKSADDAEVATGLQRSFGERQGCILSVGPRVAFPLKMKQANRVISGRVALIGSAAQTMHPVAAQGLNLGLRDAANLSAVLANADDPGDSVTLATYATARRIDSNTVLAFTHGLIKLFDVHNPVLSEIKNFSLILLDTLPPLRRKLAHQLVFGA